MKHFEGCDVVVSDISEKAKGCGNLGEFEGKLQYS